MQKGITGKWGGPKRSPLTLNHVIRRLVRPVQDPRRVLPALLVIVAALFVLASPVRGETREVAGKPSLSGGSVVVKDPESFRKVSKGIVWGVLAGLVGLSTLVLVLLYGLRQRGRVEESIAEARDELEMILEERTRDLSELNEKLSAEVGERRRAEQVLRESEEGFRNLAAALDRQSGLMRALLDSIPDLIFYKDHEGVYLGCNKAFEAFAGRTEQELAGLTDFDLFPKEVAEFFRAMDRLMFSRRIARRNEEWVDYPDGRRLLLDTLKTPFYDRDGKLLGLIGISRDITARRRMEEEVLKAQKLDSLGVLAGGIAHDFNNLLTGILGNITLLKMSAERGSKAYERLEKTEKACERSRDLTQQLLTFSRGGSPVKKTASMSQIIMDSASFVLRGSNVRCEFTLPEDLWAVEADEGQMSQVINNLIINADQAMADGGIIAVRADNVTLGADERIPLAEGRYILVSIRDQGVGIPKENLAKIFDPYFTTKQKGSGLGLSTVYSIIRNHGGYVEAESTPGSGTVFRFYLPASDRDILAQDREEERESPETGTGRILLMDDEEIIREVAREILEHLGYRVDECGDGTAAVTLYREAFEAGEPYSAVIMDLTVPGGMGGKEAMLKLLEIDPAARGIVSSGYSNDPILAFYREYGFCGVVTKPYNVKDLQATLQSLAGGA